MVLVVVWCGRKLLCVVVNVSDNGSGWLVVKAAAVVVLGSSCG